MRSQSKRKPINVMILQLMMILESHLRRYFKLYTNKASGPDCISAHMLKATTSSIPLPLTTLFNLSLSTGKFPDIWKLAGVVPIPKSKDKNDPCNYRLISLLSIVSKILEKIVYSIPTNIIHYHNLNGAFRKGNLLPMHYFQQSVTGIYFLTSELMFFDFKKHLTLFHMES